MKHVVAAADAIAPGGRLVVEAGGKRIVVWNLGGEFFALADRCPHQGGPLSAGQVMGHVCSAAPGEYSYDRRGEIVRCPWHAWEFDIRTGRSVFDPRRVKTRRFPATVECGEVLAAERFAVAVEGRYVVLEI